jgi:hypothetical protein
MHNQDCLDASQGCGFLDISTDETCETDERRISDVRGRKRIVAGTPGNETLRDSCLGPGARPTRHNEPGVWVLMKNPFVPTRKGKEEG